MGPPPPLLALLAAASLAQEPAPAARARRIEARGVLRAVPGPVDVPLSLALSNFLLDHPDLAADLARRWGVAPYRASPRGPARFWVDDGEGTSGMLTLVERGDAGRLYLAEGAHRGAAFPEIRAEAALRMALDETIGADCRPRTRATFSVSVSMRSRVVSGVAAVLRPFLRRTISGKFTKAFLAARKLGRLLAEEPEVAAREAEAFPGLDEKARARFRELLRREENPAPRCAGGGAVLRYD